MERFLIQNKEVTEWPLELPYVINLKSKDFNYYMNLYNLKKYFKVIKIREGSKVKMEDEEDFYTYGFNEEMYPILGSVETIKSIDTLCLKIYLNNADKKNIQDF